ncbi:hypothetical protein NLI96_g10165 [Meripilus lineatus]|uniref:Mitogen-activated protein kinase kinase kinase 1 n=1 Tax=Meripilus lineatus TaxID=2056292 RepID=A0AAD5YEG9_9APHY|nr:hypothetical protein NLI96_g10165 [Physisporinus lineatus]
MGRKRKAAEYDPYTDWVPTVPPPHCTSSSQASSSRLSGPSSSLPSGSQANPIELDLTPPPSPPPAPPPSLPPAKKQRQKKDPNEAAPEKRGAAFKKKCPKNILERVERVISQRFFMIDRSRIGDELREEFSVLGSTGNVYTVVIDKKPSCSCPDSMKGNHCKHILFIFLKVLQVTQASGYWYQKALLTSELEDIFNNAPPAPAAVANARVQEAYSQATGKSSSTSDTGSSNKRIPGPEDDCPICYENMHKVAEKSLSFCHECGNALHKECFQQWSRAATGGVTCVFCRTEWVTPSTSKRPATAGVRTSEGYVNLANVAGVSTMRDTSSYYHGPSRGSRYYGYQHYDEDY